MQLHCELVRYATLVPPTHNTQCWKFSLLEQVISLEADLARRCPAVDPDGHHLFVSLGCALENLSEVALANGPHVDAVTDTIEGGKIAALLTRPRAVVSPLFGAIPLRQCTRGDYDSQPLSSN